MYILSLYTYTCRYICLLIATYICRVETRGESIADIASSSPASERRQQPPGVLVVEAAILTPPRRLSTLPPLLLRSWIGCHASVCQCKPSQTRWMTAEWKSCFSLTATSERAGGVRGMQLAYLCRKGATPLANTVISVLLMQRQGKETAREQMSILTRVV